MTANASGQVDAKSIELEQILIAGAAVYGGFVDLLVDDSIHLKARLTVPGPEICADQRTYEYLRWLAWRRSQGTLMCSLQTR